MIYYYLIQEVVQCRWIQKLEINVFELSSSTLKKHCLLLSFVDNFLWWSVVYFFRGFFPAWCKVRDQLKKWKRSVRSFFWHISNPRFFRPRVAFPTTAFSQATYTYMHTKKRYSLKLSMYHCGNNHYLNHWNLHQMSKLLSANL